MEIGYTAVEDSELQSLYVQEKVWGKLWSFYISWDFAGWACEVSPDRGLQTEGEDSAVTGEAEKGKEGSFEFFLFYI